MSHQNERFSHDTRIGPSDAQRQKDQERALLRGAMQIREGLKKLHEKDSELKEKYGEDLVDFGKAYFGPAIAGWVVVVRGERISKDEVRPKFASALVEKLESQPQESKGEWLSEFLKEITNYYQ